MTGYCHLYFYPVTLGGMYIRRTTVKSRKSGENYFTYRLVESRRIGGRVKQQTLLNLGRHFAPERSQWPLLTARIEQLLSVQSDFLELELPLTLEKEAQHLTSKLLQAGYGSLVPTQALQTVDIDSLEVSHPRKVGIEQIALHAVKRLGLSEKLKRLGFNRHQLASAIGNLVARMAFPASELATYKWLQQQSGLGELIGYDYENMGIDRLYHASDLLWKHKNELEDYLYQTERSLFSLEETVTLYDLTNTFFEGQAAGSKKAQRGRSKEKRSDCPLITLGLVLDGSGFPRCSRHFKGNASEPKTLQVMLQDLGTKKDSTVVMDAGIASEENIAWLVKNKFRYIVVSRKMKRQFSPEQAIIVKDEPGKTVKAQRVVNEKTGEIELYCHSEAREQKEHGILNSACKRLEEALSDLHNGLSKKGTVKRITLVQQRVGKLKHKFSKAAQHYAITIEEKEGKAIAIQWQRQNKPLSQATHPGVYCLRTNHTDWDETALWQTYTMLTDLEAVFRSLKSELGMRPIYHQKEDRIEGHLFISLLAYHLVHTVRVQLKTHGIHESWEGLRRLLENRQRVTVTVKREDGKTLHIRKTTKVELHQKAILTALGLSPQVHPTQLSYI